MRVKIKKLSKDAVIPSKAHKTDFCYDCVAISEEEVAPDVWKYGLGLAFEIVRDEDEIGYVEDDICAPFITPAVLGNIVELSIDLRPRSSVWKTGMLLSNCEGTIDENYRGEVSAVFYHVMPNMPRYKVGDRIGQIKLGLTLPMEFEVVDELSETDRGTGGYGSTGK